MRKKKVKGAITSDNLGCTVGTPIRIQFRKNGSWQKVTSTFTSNNGRYSKRIAKNDRHPGKKYRALSPQFSSPDGLDICLKAVSPTKRWRR